MPTYEYSCKSCDEHLEVVQSFKDEPLTTCPACGGELRKVFGSIGIAFKGSGFYKNDSRSSSKGAPAKASSSEARDSRDSRETRDSREARASEPKKSPPKSEPASAAS